MKRWLLRGLLLLTPLVLAGAGLELYFRLRIPGNGLTPFQSTDDEAVPHVLRRSFETLHKGVTVRTNRLGFRGPEPPPLREGVQRVAVIGDSVCFGDGVEYEDSLPAQLSRLLEQAGAPSQVLGCGVPGYNIENVVALFETVVLPLQPDLVVYVFVSNDVVPSARPRTIDPEAVIDPHAGFPMGSAFLQWAGVRVRAAQRRLGKGGGQGWVGSVLQAFQSGGRQRVERELTRLRDLCAGRGIRLVVASYPFMVRPDRNPFRPIDEDVARRCGRLGIEFVALVEAFAPDEDLTAHWVHPLDSHPDAEAHRRAAAVLAQHLAP